MLSLLKDKPSVLIEAEKAKFKPPVIVQVLIFGLIMFVLQIPLSLLFSPFPTSTDFGYAINVFSPICYVVLIFIYCLFIEKRSLYSMGFTKNKAIRKYLLGLAIGIASMTFCVLVCTLFGAFSFEGLTGVNPWYILFIFFGFLF